MITGGLQESSTTSATEIIGSVGVHIDEVFFTNHGFDYKAQLIRHPVSKRFADQLARILDSKLDLQVFVPVRADRKLTFPDPLSVKRNNALDFKFRLNIELLQSLPDRVKFVASLGVQPVFAVQVLHSLDFIAHYLFPAFIV